MNDDKVNFISFIKEVIDNWFENNEVIVSQNKYIWNQKMKMKNVISKIKMQMVESAVFLYIKKL